MPPRRGSVRSEPVRRSSRRATKHLPSRASVFEGEIMGRTTITVLLCFAALTCQAAPAPEGRWEGVIRIPGNDQPVIVDLAPASPSGWMGSIILMGLGIKGAPLSNIAVTESDVSFEMGSTLGDA